MAGLNDLIKDLDRKFVGALTRGARKAAEQIVIDLQDRGPQYSGHFASSWKVVEGSVDIRPATPGPGAAVGVSRTTAPSISGATFRQRVWYTIGNDADYRDVALDLVPGSFSKQDFLPIKTPVSIGERSGSFRGQVKNTGAPLLEGDIPDLSTAKRDWFTTYMNGGEFDRRFKFSLDNELK
jgi:hypothetical protein